MDTPAVDRSVVSAKRQTGRPGTGLSRIPLTIIEPSHGWISLKLRELIEYRDLLFFLAWRDVAVRCWQTTAEVKSQLSALIGGQFAAFS